MKDTQSHEPVFVTTEHYGVVMDAAPYNGPWTRTFTSALESGKIRARASRNPPHTGNEILDGARSLSPAWWARYFCAEGLPRSMEWTKWLRDDVLVDLDPTLKIFTTYLESERVRFGVKCQRGRLDDVWSDLEALAWFASKDEGLVLRLRDFGHQDASLGSVARAVGLRYLTFHVAAHYCQCGAERSLLKYDGPDACSCVRSAWEKMVGCLRSGLLTVDLVGRGQVAAGEFRTARWSSRAGSFTFIGQPGEFLFEKDEVRSVGGRNNLRPGRRKGSVGCDDSKHLEEMRRWLSKNPNKTPRDAAKLIEAIANKNGSSQTESFIRRLVRKHDEGASR